MGLFDTLKSAASFAVDPLGIAGELNPLDPYSTVGGFLNPGAQTAADNAALVRSEASNLQFTPVNVSTASGNVVSNPDGSVSTSLSPELQALADRYGTVAGPSVPYQPSTDLNSIRGMFSDIGQGQIPGVSSSQLTAANAIRQGVGNTGMFGDRPTAGAGMPTLADRPQEVPIQQQAVTGADRGMFSSNVQGPNTNQSNLLKEQYATLKAAIAPQQDRARSSQEARLLAQGRLGSTGGGIQQESLQRAQDAQDLGLLNQAFGQALAVGNQDINRFQVQSGDEFRRQGAFANQDFQRQSLNGQFGDRAQALALQQAGMFGNLDINRFNAGVGAQGQTFNQELAGRQQDINLQNNIFNQGLQGNNAFFNMMEVDRQANSPERALALRNAAARGMMGIDAFGLDMNTRQQDMYLKNLAAYTGLLNAPNTQLPISLALGQGNYGALRDRFNAITGAETAVNNAEMGNALLFRDALLGAGTSVLSGGIPMPGLFGTSGSLDPGLIGTYLAYNGQASTYNDYGSFAP